MTIDFSAFPDAKHHRPLLALTALGALVVITLSAIIGNWLSGYHLAMLLLAITTGLTFAVFIIIGVWSVGMLIFKALIPRLKTLSETHNAAYHPEVADIAPQLAQFATANGFTFRLFDDPPIVPAADYAPFTDDSVVDSVRLRYQIDGTVNGQAFRYYCIEVGLKFIGPGLRYGALSYAATSDGHYASYATVLAVDHHVAQALTHSVGIHSTTDRGYVTADGEVRSRRTLQEMFAVAFR